MSQPFHKGTTMNYYLGGYYLVEGVSRPSYSATFLPSMVWSISDCISPIYPNSWGLPWASTTEEELLATQTRLGLTNAEFKEMQDSLNTAFNEEHFGWPNVWLNLNDAQEYYKRYLQTLPQVKLLAIGISTYYFDECLEAAQPDPGMGEAGLYLRLLEPQKLANLDHALGFELLNMDVGNIGHSFLCNHLEKEYQKMELAFNEHGLLAKYDDAKRAEEFTNLDTTAAEPGPWFPWLIVEYPLTSESNKS
jgi:hypothetical protein